MFKMRRPNTFRPVDEAPRRAVNQYKSAVADLLEARAAVKLSALQMTNYLLQQQAETQNPVMDGVMMGAAFNLRAWEPSHMMAAAHALRGGASGWQNDAINHGQEYVLATLRGDGAEALLDGKIGRYNTLQGAIALLERLRAPAPALSLVPPEEEVPEVEPEPSQVVLPPEPFIIRCGDCSQEFVTKSTWLHTTAVAEFERQTKYKWRFDLVTGLWRCGKCVQAHWAHPEVR